jgi:hypothetical protein
MHSVGLKRAVPDPMAGTALEKDLLDSEEPLDFLYVVGGIQGGVDEYYIVRVDRKGICDYRFPDFGNGKQFMRKRISFQLEKGEIQKLRKVLADNDLFRLPKAYETDTSDGTTLHIRCNFCSRTKDVVCNNYFPTPILNIHDEVMENLLNRHAKEIENAEIVPGDRSGLEELLDEVDRDNVENKEH